MLYYIFAQHLDFRHSHFLLLLPLPTSTLKKVAIDSPVLIIAFILVMFLSYKLP